MAWSHYESVNVINQIIDEVQSHKTRMALFPLRNMLNLNSMKHITSQSFNTLNLNEQIQLVLKLIDNGHYEFKETIAFLLSNEVERQFKKFNVRIFKICWLQYPININKMNYSVNVIPNELNGLEHTELKLNNSSSN